MLGALQDVTTRTLVVEMWGSNCNYTVNDVLFPGLYLGKTDITVTPLQV